MSIILYLLYAILAIIIIIAIWFVMSDLMNKASAQNATPPAVTPTAPTVTNVPTPTTPAPNFQYLPQKAYVQPFAPEVGVPTNAIPLTSVPQVVPVQPQVQTQSSGIAGFDIASIISMVIAGGSGLLAKMGLDKAKQSQETSRDNSVQIVKGAAVDQSLAKQVYENMPDKGESIKDAPEIRLEKLAENKEEAAVNASKA